MSQSRFSNLFSILIPALLILFVLSVQAHHFHDRAYRQDEAWVVHYAVENIQRVGFFNHIMQIFRFLPPENVLQDVWVYLFGHVEPIVRFFSTLTTFITLAVFYRLVSDLFDKQTGRIAVILLGTLSMFVFYTHEARPYAALAFGTVGFQWALLRFIRQPNRTYAVLALLFGVIPFYQHPFLLYVYGAQVICILVFVRWNRDLYLRGMTLFATLTALISIRIFINFSSREGQIDYSTPTTLEGVLNLYNEFKFNPEFLGLFLLLAGFLIPITYLKIRNDSYPTFRFGIHWRQGWMVVTFVAMLMLVLGVNAISPNVTPRNLLIIAPSIAMIASYALRHVPWQGQWVALVIFCVPFVTQFRTHNSNAGYWEVRDYMAEHYDTNEGRILVIAPQIWEWIPIKYYLDEQTDLSLTNDDILYVSVHSTDRFAPHSLEDDEVVRGYGDADFEQLQTYLGERDKVWVIETTPYSGGDNVMAWLDERYTTYNQVSFPGEGYYRALEIIEYRRQPQSLDTVVRFGEEIRLEGWTLNDSVEIQPCQTLSVDTWWQTDDPSDALYSSTLVIADANGQGIANADDMPGGMFMTSIWEADTLYFDERNLTVPCDIDSGQYLLLLGLYDIETVENLPVNSADGLPMGTNLLYLTTLTVE